LPSRKEEQAAATFGYLVFGDVYTPI